MKKWHRSVTQHYIDLTDRLAAVRSALELLYAIIGLALIVSCAMYIFYDIIPVKGAFSLNGEQVSVMVQVRGYEPQEGDIVVLRKSRLCATVLSEQERANDNRELYALQDGQLLVNVNHINGSKNVELVDTEEVEGTVRFVVFPLNRFGENINKLFGSM